MSIKYLVDIGERTAYPPERALADATVDTGENIFVLSIEDHPTVATYWSDWNGTYDNPETRNISLFFGLFLVQVYSSAALLLTIDSFFVEGDFVKINIGKKPWQYLSALTEFLLSLFFSSAALDESDPSKTTIKDAGGDDVPYSVRLNIPSLPLKLSDPITGSTIFGTFSVSLENGDGKYDDFDSTSFLNSRINTRRSDIDNPALEDFDIIRSGQVESLKATSTLLSIKSADYFRTFKEAVCDKFAFAEFPLAPSDTLGKDIPIAYGAVLGVPLFGIGGDDFIAIDQGYLTSVQDVYDQDGASISFTLLNGIITATGAKSADVTGLLNNRIGELITSEIALKSNIQYLPSSWDKTETDLYVNSSAKIGLYIKGGNVRQLIEEAFKSATAFLFTKTNGKLTIRQWGQKYETYIIPSWKIMAIPTKDDAESVKFYNSTVSIKFGKREDVTEHDFEISNKSRELELIQKYRKSSPVTYSTRMLEQSAAEGLARLMLNRFGDISEILTISLGENTAQINPLDRVNMLIQINDRTFSQNENWIVREVNPAQDTLVLESFVPNPGELDICGIAITGLQITGKGE